MQLINNIEPNKPSAFKSLGGKAAECIPPDMNFPKESVKTTLHWYLVTIQRDVHIYIYL